MVGGMPYAWAMVQRANLSVSSLPFSIKPPKPPLLLSIIRKLKHLSPFILYFQPQIHLKKLPFIIIIFLVGSQFVACHLLI